MATSSYLPVCSYMAAPLQADESSLHLPRLGLTQASNDSQASYAHLLRACGDLKDLSEGLRLHKSIITSDLHKQERFLHNLLIEMYGKCGALPDAHSVFDDMHRRNVFSWNLIIAAYAQHGHFKEALWLFQEMRLEEVTPDKFTFLSCLSACADLEALAQGILIHAAIVEEGDEFDVSVGTALIHMYAKCRKLHDALTVFDRMHHHDVVSWTALITACAQHGHGQMAFQMFQKMQKQQVMPNNVTMTSVLGACASLAALEEGQLVHAHIIEEGCECQIVVGSALINMYSKCGNLDDACILFDKLHQRNVVIWNAMISAYSQHGHYKFAVDLFKCMQIEATQPNEVTFLIVLSACSHAGLVGEGYGLFISMKDHYKLDPSMRHYGCMIDLLSRAGRLDEAEDFMNDMPLPPDSQSWEILLGACRMFGDSERGKRVAERVMELDPLNESPYILLSNIYAAEGKWAQVAELKRRMAERDLKKPVGCSLVIVEKELHEFSVEDALHPEKELVYADLERLRGQMEEECCLSGMGHLNISVEDEVDAQKSLYHSEKLAISFGLLFTAPGTPLRIVTNLRICADCHATSKFISKATGRELMLRDNTRFHRFFNGVCSCGDYW